ncbi:MAG: hypothetical protein DRI01_03475 [Chloroflexi bacterium]|nr:MAG: hypothetical protein DRI01_03475 [Chloroflexota bacterium]
MQCEEVVEKTLSELSSSFRCITYDKGLCIVTPYFYPDNDLIEVFVEELAGGLVRVTDLGETLRHLASQGIDVLNSPKRRFMLEQIAKRLHVVLTGGRLEKEGTPQQVGSLLLDVTAAAHSVAGLAYTSKAYEPAEFPEEVSAFLRDNQIDHESRPRIKGISGREYRVSIRIDGTVRPEILVEAMSPSQEAVMTTVVNRVVRQWVDIDSERHKVSLLNDVDFRWRSEDVILLGNLSAVHRWSEKDAFLKFIKEPTGNQFRIR